jgi:hypothetical protein
MDGDISNRGLIMNSRTGAGLVIFLELILLYGFKIMLDLIFVYYALPTYFYEPYYNLYGSFRLDRLVPGYILLPLIWFWVRPVLRNPQFSISRMLITFQLLFLVIPAFTVYSQANRPEAHLFWILIGFIVLVLTVRGMPVLSIPIPPREVSFSLSALGLVIVAYVYTSLVIGGGLERLNFNLLEVYSFREAFVNKSFPLSNYLVPWVAYVINMALLIYMFFRRKIFAVGLVLILQGLIFAMTNFKAFLFLPFLVLVLLWILPRLNFPRLTLLGGVVLMALLWMLTQLGQPLGLGIADRAFYLPAAMQSLYFDYFSTHPLAYMSGSPWVGFLGIQTPYPTTSVSLIAQEYWGRDFSPNVGWIGSAYADFGEFGVVAFAVVLGLFLRLADSIAVRVSIKGIPEALFIGPALALTNASLTTSLLTHGGLVALVTLWVLSRKLRFLNKQPTQIDR